MKQIFSTLAFVVAIAACSGPGPAQIASAPESSTASLSPVTATTAASVASTAVPTILPSLNGPSTTATPLATSVPTAEPTPQPTPQPTPEPTATPEPSAAVVLGKLTVVKWTDSIGYFHYQVIQAVTNTGTGEATVTGGDFTAYASDGSVTDTGSLSTAVPPFLAPGESGYILGAGQSNSFGAGDVAKVETNGTFETRDADVPHFPATKVKHSKGDYGDRVTGIIENDSDQDVSLMSVVALFLNSSGSPLGFETGYISKVNKGTSKAFVIDSLRTLKNVDEVKVFAAP